MRMSFSLPGFMLLCVFLFVSAANAQTSLPLHSAEQSSTAFRGVASRAIDGNTNGRYRKRSVTHTANEFQPWWQASLERVELVSEIIIHNRVDGCCTNRLNKFYVYLSDQPFDPGANRTYLLDNNPNVHKLAYVHELNERSVSIPVNRFGKYIRVQLSAPGTLSLAEVEVIRDDSEVFTELGLTDAKQSSTLHSGVASRAIDGNTSGIWRNGSITHTVSEAQPWWEAKLTESANIKEIQLWNRTNCCAARLANFFVFVSDIPISKTAGIDDLIDDPDVSWSYKHGTLAESNITIPVGQRGKYVRIQLSGTGILSLAEVKLFGVSIPDSGTTNYRKSLYVMTSKDLNSNGFGGYGGFGEPGFGFNGFNSLQSYSTWVSFETVARNQSRPAFLIDGAERTSVSSPPIFDPNWRKWEVSMGLANGYLHILTTIYKSNSALGNASAENFPPQIVDSPDQIWNDDSFEIYFNTGNESAPGYDDNDFSRVYRFNDTSNYVSQAPAVTHTGINSRLALTDETVCNIEEYGAHSCETRFSLEELGIAGLDVAEIGFDIHMNFDDDGGDRDAKYSWCSGETLSAWRDMSVVDCSLRIVNDCDTSCEGF